MTLALLALAGALAFAAGEGEATASDGETPTLQEEIDAMKARQGADRDGTSGRPVG